MKNTFLKQVRELRDAMPNHKFKVEQLANTNYIVASPLYGISGAVEMMDMQRAGVSYIVALNLFVTMIKGNNQKLYR
jgi:hypothetical protein